MDPHRVVPRRVVRKPGRRTVGALVRVGLLAFAVASFLPSVAAQSGSGEWIWPMRLTSEVPDETYVTGYFTHSGGQAGIAWDPAAPTTDPSPGDPSAVAGASASYQAWAGWTLRTATAGQSGKELIPTFTFTSSPFPERVFVNVSRLTQVDIYTDLAGSGQCASRFDLVAYVDDKLWGGQVRSLRWMADQDTWRPKNVAGYCWFSFRFHSELDVIPQGAVLKLEFLFHHHSFLDQKAPRFGLAEPHRSVLRIPTYGPADVITRRPEFVGAPQPSDDEEGSEGALTASPWLMPGAPIAAVGLLGFQRAAPARRKVVVVLALVLLGGMAGCFGPPPAEAGTEQGQKTGGEQEVTIVKDNETGLAGEGFGSILGTVQDDRRIPVVGAHVSLLGSSNFTDTDKLGRFVFANLTPTTYAYRIDKSGFFSFEGKVQVKAGHVSKVDVALEPVEKLDADERSHNHDYWPADGQKVLLSEPVDLAKRDVPSNAFVCTSLTNAILAHVVNAGGACMQEFRLPPGDDFPNTIYPGTLRIEVRVKWNRAALPVEGIGLAFRDNEFMPSFNQVQNWTFMYPRGPDVVFSIPTSWEMTDAGHQMFSLWEWMLYVPFNDENNLGMPKLALVAGTDGRVSVDVKIYKGVVPLEPAHPDHWKGQDQIVLIEKAIMPFKMVPTSVVPSDTTWLEVQLNSTRNSQQITSLFVKPASVPPPPTNDPERGYTRVSPVSGNEASRLYRIPVGPGEGDAFYARKSNYGFLRIVDDTPANTIAGLTEFGQPARLFELTVIAHRDPMPG